MLRSIMLVMTIAAAALPVQAAAPTPICRLPTVMDRMAAELHRNPYYSRLDPALIVEMPTADPRVVRCALCLNIIVFDTGRLGDGPVARCEARAFNVRALPNGFVVGPPR
jgi:hypothetical protein